MFEESLCSNPDTGSRSNLTEQDIAAELYTTHDLSTPPLDILVRTSDVRRLSDFLLWQVSMHIELADPTKTPLLTPLLDP